MATLRIQHGGGLRLLGAALATAAAVGVIAFVLGGGSWLTSPAIWGTVVFVAIALFVAARARRRPLLLLLALPVVIGGAAAVVAGAWDYGPWLASPLVWVGLLGSCGLGASLVGSHRAATMEVVEGVVLGALIFGLGLLAVFAGVVFVAVVWHPFGA